MRSAASASGGHLLVAAAGAIVAGAALLGAVYFMRTRSVAVPATPTPTLTTTFPTDADDSVLASGESPFANDFSLALAFVRSNGGASLSVSTRLDLYGAFKVSEFSRAGRAAGPTFPRPSPLLDAAGSAKWDAWTAAAVEASLTLSVADVDMTIANAIASEERYVSILTTASPAWRDTKREKAGSGGVGGSEADEKSIAIGAAVSSIPLVRALSDADIAALRIDIHAAARGGRAIDVASLLAVAFASGGVEARTSLACALTEDGETPLHCAADAGCAASVRELVFAGADVGARDPVGLQTPLHYAAAQGRADAVDALLDSIADVSAKDIDGETPLGLWANADDVSQADRERIERRMRALAANY